MQYFVSQGPQHNTALKAKSNGKRRMIRKIGSSHEASTTVLRTGSGVRILKKGDQVAVEPSVPCRHCAHCAEGLYDMCFGMRFAASLDENIEEGKIVVKSTPGTLCKYLVLPESLCNMLPAHIGLAEGALVGPLPMGVQP